LTRPPWPPVKLVAPPPLPERVEVLILGASLAGLSCAHLLAEAGVNVVVVDANASLGQCAVGRSAGLANLGLCEHPGQLVDAIGMDDAQALFELSAKSLRLLNDHADWFSKGEIACASMDREDQAIVRSAGCLNTMGIENRLVEKNPLWTILGCNLFEMGRDQPLGGSLNPRLLLQTLAQKAEAAGAHLQLGFESLRISRSGSALLLQGVQGQCLAELVVFANGWRGPNSDSWFAEKVFPVRAQHCWRPGRSALRKAGRTQHGYLTWGPTPDGVVVSGCRWGSPHMEVGETEDVLNPKISEHLAKFVHKFSQESGGNLVEWTSIMDFSCDGIPLLGPLPGQARKIACVGFGGQDLGLALGCAEAVVEGILHGRAPLIPKRFHASRLL